MVLPFTLSQRCLHPGNCLLPGGLFLPAPLLPLERKCALRAAVSSVVRGTWSFGFARVFFGLGLGPSPAKSVGRSACSLNGPSDPTGRRDNDARFRHSRSNNLGGSSLSPWRLPDGKDCSPRPRLPRPPSSRAPLSQGRKSQEKPGMSSVFAALPTRATS
jgi:hypothetical protein